MMLWLITLVACEEPPPLPEGPKVQTLLGEALGIHFVGNWTSPSCGARSYARNIHFEADNQYAAIDLVSPCPPGASCIWSGLVGYAGTWVIKDQTLILKEMHAPGAPGSPHPQAFKAAMDGKLMEGDCPYTQGLTIPEGFTEAQVTPRAPGQPEPINMPTTPGSTAPEGAPEGGAPDGAAPEGGAPTPGSTVPEGTIPEGAAPASAPPAGTPEGAAPSP